MKTKEMFSSLEEFAARMLSNADAPIPEESPSEFDGKCLHCDHFAPSPTNPFRGLCCREGARVRTRNGGESCGGYAPTPKSERGPWHPDPEYFAPAERTAWRKAREFLGFAMVWSAYTWADKWTRFHPGDVVGRLEVLELMPRGRVRVRCAACGNVQVRLVNELARAKAKGVMITCGCMSNAEVKRRNAEALVGKKFGRLTVIGVAPSCPGVKSHTEYVCRCDCGNVAHVDRNNLISGKQIGCFACRGRSVSETFEKKRERSVGKTVGKWVIAGMLPPRPRPGNPRKMVNWCLLRCACCGREVESRFDRKEIEKRACPECRARRREEKRREKKKRV